MSALDKVLILYRYLLLETELQWFYYSLFLYIKQEIQQEGKKCYFFGKFCVRTRWGMPYCFIRPIQ